MRGFCRGGGRVVALVNIGPRDGGEERGLEEASHSQRAVIKESGSFFFFGAGKGEAHLIKTEMLQPPVKTHG